MHLVNFFYNIYRHPIQWVSVNKDYFVAQGLEYAPPPHCQKEDYGDDNNTTMVQVCQDPETGEYSEDVIGYTVWVINIL